MEQISVFDIIKIGIGPSSSHTMGPWLAAARAIDDVQAGHPLTEVARVRVELYGSLAKTGKGHGTDLAVLLGLSGYDFTTIDTTTVEAKAKAIRTEGTLQLGGTHAIPFEKGDLVFAKEQTKDFHPNGLSFFFTFTDGETATFTYFSVGGGFVVAEGETALVDPPPPLPYPIHTAKDLLAHCVENDRSISDVVRANERRWRTPEVVADRLDALWTAMRDCVYRGCHASGILPGGLEVKRRAPGLNRKLLEADVPVLLDAWLASIQRQQPSFQRTLKWVSCFAIAANEENAAYGRVVTAPTNGASGVIPAVLMYLVCFCENVTPLVIRDFLLVAGEIGSLFKKGATISAAMGGCQAEIGVSSAMAAAALTAVQGGSPAQALMAAEIAMEHHLGLTCDPIAGLVQIPCIERNSMGAIKAITASQIALESDPADAKVSLDACIKSMWSTAQDMNSKYKETSEGGLAVHIPVYLAEC